MSKFAFRIKPYSELRGKGTKKDALNHLYSSFGLSPYPTTYSPYGDYQTRTSDFGKPWSEQNAWLYTVQVYKRGKYRTCKHYCVRVYKIPIAILDYFKVNVFQKRNGIKVARMK